MEPKDKTKSEECVVNTQEKITKNCIFRLNLVVILERANFCNFVS